MFDIDLSSQLRRQANKLLVIRKKSNIPTTIYLTLCIVLQFLEQQILHRIGCNLVCNIDLLPKINLAFLSEGSSVLSLFIDVPPKINQQKKCLTFKLFTAELMFLETSALTGENVEEAFLKCSRTILGKIETGKLETGTL